MVSFTVSSKNPENCSMKNLNRVNQKFRALKISWMFATTRGIWYNNVSSLSCSVSCHVFVFRCHKIHFNSVAILVRLNRNIVAVSYSIQPDACHTFPTLSGVSFFRRFSSYLHYHLFLPDHSLSASLHPVSQFPLCLTWLQATARKIKSVADSARPSFLCLCVTSCAAHDISLFPCDITAYKVISLHCLFGNSTLWSTAVTIYTDALTLSTFYAHGLLCLYVLYVCGKRLRLFP